MEKRMVRKTTNRTILELKFKFVGRSTNHLDTTNRTILELKLTLYIKQWRFGVLPIAPYWNWNYIRNGSVVNETSYQSHHTGIEISDCRTFNDVGKPTNRTILELKYKMYRGLCQRKPTTNRTILELKSKAKTFLNDVLILPIAPYWNWNIADAETDFM